MRRAAVLGVVVFLLAFAGTVLWRVHRPVTATSLASTSASTSTSASAVTTTTVAGPANVCAASPTTSPSAACPSWRPTDRWSGAVASIYTTTLIPNPAQPAVTAYAAWIRTSSTDLALYPGYEGPGPSALPRGPEMVPPQAYPRLLATFNSGFYEKDGAAGFYTNHTLYFPMMKGLATIVRYTNGKVDVVAWAGGARPGPTVAMARQNLPLLVNGGRPTTIASNNSLWGLTLHGVPAVWRTALGIDANGNLIYAAASDVTSLQMASIMVDLHAVRAMELDINPEWPIFVTYGAPGAVNPTLVVPNPNQIARRFLYPSTKDFFAVFRSLKPGEAQPW